MEYDIVKQNKRRQKMILFHGSNTENIKILEPRQADHDRPYIYLTTLEIVAGFYLINAVERPYYWFLYGFGRNGIEYHELFPNALKEAASMRKPSRVPRRLAARAFPCISRPTKTQF